MIIGILKEQLPEKRVSLVPDIVKQLGKQGVTVWVEPDAGAAAFYADDTYLQAGANVRPRADILQQSDLVCSIQIPEDWQLLRTGTILAGVYQPLHHHALMQQWADHGLTSYSLDNIPRTTRAQSMDVLSSQANIAGYKAVLVAAVSYGRYFPMLMTAAGSIAPAKVLILGAGVAGLQAIATARRLGGVVEVFDTRPVVKEEVMSLGAKFIAVEGAADASQAGGYAVEQSAVYKQQQEILIAASIAKADIVITTAQIPGKRAPLLVTASMINNMRPGSVIIDLAAGTGGNTALTKDQQTVLHNGITIIGDSNLPASMPADASKLYAKNIFNFLQLLIKEGQLINNLQDDIIKGACITHEGTVISERLQAVLK